MTASAPFTDPLQKMDRIITLDVLRGFALFGILYAHMIFWYAAGPLPQETYQLYKDLGSGIAIGAYMILILSKFFAIFSFLFGLSFYIQIQGLVKRHEPVITRFGWRLAILGAIGLVHHAFWRADILSIYVPLGFLLLFLRNLSNKALLIIGALLVLNVPTKLAELISIIVRDKLMLLDFDQKTAGAEYYAIVSQGSWGDMVKHNINAMADKYVYQINSGRLLITFGFFLLGMLAGRMQWFENIADQISFFRTVLKKSSLLLVMSLVLGIALGITAFLLKIDMEKTPVAGWLGGFILEFFNLGLTLTYITGISLLMLKPKWENWLTPLAAVGKMALTSYLMQTIIGVFIFFNIGLGLFTKTSPGMNALLCCVIFGLQILFCRWWLQYFHYGPVEWLWRSATDFKWQPLYKQNIDSKLRNN
ncbi:MAG: hypothetical protein K0Q78_394 [Cellvibrio sp.]|nr:hypothetical protein [Cellvibrio sp.]